MTIDNSKYSITVARSKEELESIKEIWSQWVWHYNADYQVYLDLLETRSEIERPHVIVVKEQDQPKVLLIGRIEVTPIVCKLGYLTILRINLKKIAFIHGGVLGDWDEEITEFVYQNLREQLNSGEAEASYFNMLDTDSLLYKKLRNGGILEGDIVPVFRTHWQLNYPASYEEYLETLSKKKRRNLKTYRNKFNREHPDQELKVYRSPDELDEIMTSAEAIAKKSYKRGMDIGFKNDEENRKRTLMQLEKGWLHAYILYVNQKPSAYCFVVRYGDVLFARGRDYDPEFRKYRLGHFLQDQINQDFCGESGVSLMDFGFGDAEYKKEICDVNREESSLYLFSSGFKIRLINMIRIVVTGISNFVQGITQKLNLEQKLKRLWRDRLRKPQSENS